MRSLPCLTRGKFTPHSRRSGTGGAGYGKDFFGIGFRRSHGREIVRRSALRTLVNCEQTRSFVLFGPSLFLPVASSRPRSKHLSPCGPRNRRSYRGLFRASLNLL